MDNAIYATLTRQSGLMSQMRTVANDIANAATTGYRGQAVTFSEHVARLGPGRAGLSMARASVPATDLRQGALERTGGPLDLAIEGEGFFLVLTPEGERLTRAGHFMASATGGLVTADGHPVLGEGGAPILVPPGARIGVGPDGTLSGDGRPLGRIAVVAPADPLELRHASGTRFVTQAHVPAGGRVLQGHLEASNVSPVVEMARMIEVQRAYELGQRFLEREDERVRAVLRTLGE